MSLLLLFHASSQTKTHSVDTYIVRAGSKQASIDALIKKTQTKTASLDANIRQTLTKSASIDSLIAKQLTKSNSVDSLIPTTRKTGSIDALIQQRKTKTHSVDAYISDTFTITHSIDVLKKKTQTKTYSAISLIKQTRTKSHSVDASIATEIRHLVDALIKTSKSKTNSVDAYIVTSNTNTKNNSVDARIVNKRTKTHAADALKKKPLAKTHNVDADLLVGTRVRVSYNFDASRIKTIAKSYSLIVVINSTTAKITSNRVDAIVAITDTSGGEDGSSTIESVGWGIPLDATSNSVPVLLEPIGEVADSYQPRIGFSAEAIPGALVVVAIGSLNTTSPDYSFGFVGLETWRGPILEEVFNVSPYPRYVCVYWTLATEQHISASFDIDNNPAGLVGAIFGEVDRTSPIGDYAGNSNVHGTSNGILAPSVTATQRSLLLGVYDWGQDRILDGTALPDGPSTIDPDPSMTEIIEVASLYNVTEMSYKTVAAGATGTTTATAGRQHHQDVGISIIINGQ